MKSKIDKSEVTFLCGMLACAVVFLLPSSIFMGEIGAQVAWHAYTGEPISTDFLSFSLWFVCFFLISLPYILNVFMIFEIVKELKKVSKHIPKIGMLDCKFKNKEF